jgi:beta-glucosidase
MLGWFYDPIFFGKYPDEMTTLIKDGRLPTFTPEEAAMVKGSYDFLGMNHYTTNYYKDDSNSTGGGWYSDQRNIATPYGIDGKLIGPQAQSGWLFVYPPGIRGVLKWVSDRYGGPKIFVFENGVSVPGENEMKIVDAVHDQFRVDFYKAYIQNVIDAVTLDGVKLGGYFGWSLLDNFEWADGYSTRFGMTYVDYRNNQKRYMKDSIIWYSQFTRQGSSPSVSFDFVNPYSELYQRDVNFFLAQ